MKRITASLIAASLGLVSQATAAQTDTYGLDAVPMPGQTPTHPLLP